jgi:putative endonuclease
VGPPTKGAQFQRSFSDFMDNCCYIIYSISLDKFYIGACHENLDDRIFKHNTHFYGNHRFTAAASDWELFLKIPTTDYPQAIRIEQKIKAMKSSKYIQNLIKYPEIIDKIINETSNDSAESFRHRRS